MPLALLRALKQLFDPDGPDTPLRRLATLLGEHAERLEAALPGEASKADRFAAMREAVPMAVNHRVRDGAEAQDRPSDEDRPHRDAALLVSRELDDVFGGVDGCGG